MLPLRMKSCKRLLGAWPGVNGLGEPQALPLRPIERGGAARRPSARAYKTWLSNLSRSAMESFLKGSFRPDNKLPLSAELSGCSAKGDTAL
jgi:hypothetical protein